MTTLFNQPVAPVADMLYMFILSFRYQRLMTTLFNQPVAPVADMLYDTADQMKNEATVLHFARTLQHVRDVITQVFLRHNAVFLQLPLLMPKNKFLDGANTAAKFLDQVRSISLLRRYSHVISSPTIFSYFFSRSLSIS